MIDSQLVNKAIRLEERDTVHQERTRTTIDLQLEEQKSKEQFKPAISAAARLWKRAISFIRQAMHCQDHIAICTSEHMTTVNAFDHGHNTTRKGCPGQCSCNNMKVSLETNLDLLVVSPVVDGRIKDEGSGE